jgi:hypothetical protein
MAKLINVEQTVKNILAVEGVQFKLLKRDEKANTALLVTSTNDDFQRGLISIDPNKFSVGLQSPDEDGKISLILQPITADFLEVIALIDEPSLPIPVETPIVTENKE